MGRAIDRRLKSLEHEVAKVAPGKPKLSYLMVSQERYDEAVALAAPKPNAPQAKLAQDADEVIEFDDSPEIVRPDDSSAPPSPLVSEKAS
jgi:hypothetical protein